MYATEKLIANNIRLSEEIMSLSIETFATIYRKSAIKVNLFKIVCRSSFVENKSDLSHVAH